MDANPMSGFDPKRTLAAASEVESPFERLSDLLLFLNVRRLKSFAIVQVVG
jgi:hypothetical protein